MATVAIIAEYNPFHNGHKYQIDEIRREFGNDTKIIALMSGNYTQRGDIAILDKSLRAKMAVDSGINLCIELSFPFSMASAEIFARSGVKILNAIGVVDYLSFGSESGDLDELYRTAKLMLSEEYQAALKNVMNGDNKAKGYPEQCELALKSVSDGYRTVAPSPNNILALEYIKALIETKSTIKPHTIKREGAGYNDNIDPKTQLQSATAIRELIIRRDVSAEKYIPYTAFSTLYDAIQAGEAPCYTTTISSLIIAHLRRIDISSIGHLHDLNDGLLYRLKDASFKTNNIETLVKLTTTKKFTTARIKRAIWYSYFGVTSSEILSLPEYTQLLALDTDGRDLLKRIKKLSDFPILTKPSRLNSLSEKALLQKARSDEADSIYHLSHPTFVDGAVSVRFTPYVKNGDLCE